MGGVRTWKVLRSRSVHDKTFQGCPWVDSLQRKDADAPIERFWPCKLVEIWLFLLGPQGLPGQRLIQKLGFSSENGLVQRFMNLVQTLVTAIQKVGRVRFQKLFHPVHKLVAGDSTTRVRVIQLMSEIQKPL